MWRTILMTILRQRIGKSRLEIQEVKNIIARRAIINLIHLGYLKHVITACGRALRTHPASISHSLTHITSAKLNTLTKTFIRVCTYMRNLTEMRIIHRTTEKVWFFSSHYIVDVPIFWTIILSAQTKFEDNYVQHFWIVIERSNSGLWAKLPKPANNCNFRMNCERGENIALMHNVPKLLVM